MRLFVVSDIHGFFTEFYTELKTKGFEENNPDHLLICCGDFFDRGSEPHKVIEYLTSINNVVLIRGNHEDLLEQMLLRSYPYRYDFSNGTYGTVEKFIENYNISEENSYKKVWEKIIPFLNKMVDYFETKNYIFVHGWIPCEKWEGHNKPWYQWNKKYEYIPNWRDSTQVEWETARWTNGIRRALEGIIEPDKTIVCGHWHCSYGHAKINGTEEFGETENFEPFYADRIIAIDACTAYTKKVNILVLEDDLEENNNE